MSYSLSRRIGRASIGALFAATCLPFCTLCSAGLSLGPAISLAASRVASLDSRPRRSEGHARRRSRFQTGLLSDSAWRQRNSGYLHPTGRRNEGWDSFLYNAALCHPSPQRAVPVVLHSIVRSALKRFSDFRPLISILCLSRNNKLVLSRRPGAFPHTWICVERRHMGVGRWKKLFEPGAKVSRAEGRPLVSGRRLPRSNERVRTEMVVPPLPALFALRAASERGA